MKLTITIPDEIQTVTKQDLLALLKKAYMVETNAELEKAVVRELLIKIAGAYQKEVEQEKDEKLLLFNQFI